ncbi:MAG TPA: hypothetical protein VK716_03185 [Terracidiphilus sp.]|nr:hypothetical protein [Terracidiphilus sp.]
MSLISRRTPLFAFAFAALLSVAGCHGNQSQTTTDATQPAPDQGTDPAAANLAPATYNTSSAPAAAQPSQPVASGQSYSDAPPDDSDYSEPATDYAQQAPPPLPDYQQPPDPGDGYIWTPGYWNNGSNGYYWVPGAWVEPPYSGALWTPGFWGYSGNRYAFHPGHWGTHIGFYGGINYGNGYVGLGYEGGYWNGGHFNYNRAYNNVNTTVVHNVYTYNVRNEKTVVNRVSYNGGSGGVQVRPRQPEAVARQEPYAPRMNSQIQHAESYRNDHNQYVNVNHGQPPNPAVSHPIHADPNVHPRAPEVHGGPVRPVQPMRPKPQPNHGNPHENPHDVPR